MLRAFVAVGLGLSLIGCVTRDVQLGQGDVRVLSRGHTAQLCTLPAVDLVDARSYGGLGWIGGHELLYPELLSWLQLAIAGAAKPDEGAQRLQVELVRAYIESHPSGHSFQLVLRVRDPSGGGRTRVYRGSESGVTWWGTDAEFGNYVRAAGRKAVTALLQGEAHCTQQ